MMLLVNLPDSEGEARDMGLILGREDPLEWEMTRHPMLVLLPGKFHR